MFIQTWRQHWGLSEDPFACEDADKDVILTEIDTGAVHSGFDRLFGDPRAPGPGIVFGEKGSGKSGLRLMMRRRIEDWNAEHAGERVFLVEYVDFDLYLDELQNRIGAPRDREKAAEAVVRAWTIDDHLDAILSLGVTKLVDGTLAGADKAPHLSDVQKNEIKVQTALYYRSPRLGASEALRRLRGKLGLHAMRPFFQWTLRILLTAVAGTVAVLPWLSSEAAEMAAKKWFLVAAGVLFAGTWGWAWISNLLLKARSKRAAKHVRVLTPNVAPLLAALGDLSSRDRVEAGLPGSDGASRYDQLDRFVGLLEAFGYSGFYVLLDRIDEPSLISGRPDRMRDFVEKLLDIKLLQYPALGVKLFLPIELETLHLSASPDEMKRRRLDKSNLVAELKWTGQELQEVANQRLRARLDETARAQSLGDLFEEGFDLAHLRGTMTSLGTPRYAFGFLSDLLQTYVRDLPEELADEDPAWRISRQQFDVVRAGWLDKAGRLRRSLN